MKPQKPKKEMGSHFLMGIIGVCIFGVLLDDNKKGGVEGYYILGNGWERERNKKSEYFSLLNPLLLLPSLPVSIRLIPEYLNQCSG